MLQTTVYDGTFSIAFLLFLGANLDFLQAITN